MSRSLTKPSNANKLRKIRILMVCTGNTCRSAMAESIYKAEIKKRGLSDRFTVSSAGLKVYEGDSMNPYAIEALKILGYRPHRHKARALTPSKVKNSTLVVCMTADQKRAVGAENVFTVGDITGGGDVADPYGAGISEYLRAARYIVYSVDEVLMLAEELYKRGLKAEQSSI